MDIVFIRDLTIDTVIGIYDWERSVRQTVCLDLEMAWDNRRPAQSQDIAQALDYSAVAERLIALIRDSKFLLVETMAEQCAAVLMEEFAVPWLRLSVSKPGAVREAKSVGVAIERGTCDRCSSPSTWTRSSP